MHTRSNFLSSLSRVEKRLKQETQSPEQQRLSETESLGSPLYLYNSHPAESEPFFSNSVPVSTIQQQPPQTADVNEIEMLLKLLVLEDGDQKRNGFGVGEGEDEMFYGKIVGVRGVKSERELERLNGWIEYLLNKDGEGGIKQPLRLAHLLLAKASFVHMDMDDQGPSFPTTVEDFLHYDPPVH